MNRVRVLRRKNGLALIEWPVGDDFRRSWIPISTFQDDLGSTATVEHPEYGLPFEDGIPWEEIIVMAASPNIIARELRRQGIWTIEDLRARPDDARAAIQSAYRMDLQALRLAAEEYMEVKR